MYHCMFSMTFVTLSGLTLIQDDTASPLLCKMNDMWVQAGILSIPLAVEFDPYSNSPVFSRPRPAATSGLTLSTTSQIFWTGQSHSRPSLSPTILSVLSPKQSSRPFTDVAICHVITE